MSELLIGIESERKSNTFFDVLDNPEILRVAEESYSAALSIMALNRMRSEIEDCSEILLPIDVMSSTRNKFEVESALGNGSLDYLIAEDLQEQDSMRLIDEVVNAKTFRLRDSIFQSFDYESRDYTTSGKSHREMVKRGLSPYCNEEERVIRQIEFTEEEICASVQEEFETNGLSLINIKECPNWAKEAYQKGESNTGGYVPSENKFVIQTFKFVEGGRIYQQASIPGNIISHEDILDLLGELSGKQIEGDVLDVRRMFFGSDLDIKEIIELLDRKASERVGENIYLGEISIEQDYDNIEKFNNINSDQLKDLTKKVVIKLDQMHKEKLNPLIASTVLDSYLSDIIFNDYKKVTKIIGGTFGVLISESILMNENMNRDNLPRLEYCGAGSCGINIVDQLSKSAISAKESGLKGDIGYFKDGMCGKCKSKGFYVSDNGKFCDRCRAVDIIK